MKPMNTAQQIHHLLGVGLSYGRPMRSRSYTKRGPGRLHKQGVRKF